MIGRFHARVFRPVICVAAMIQFAGCIPGTGVVIRIDSPKESAALSNIVAALSNAGFEEIPAKIVGVQAATGKAPKSRSPEMRVFQYRERSELRCSMIVEKVKTAWRVACGEVDLSTHPRLVQPPMSPDAKTVLRVLVANLRMQFGNNAVRMPRALR